MPVEIDSPEVLERTRLELAKQASIIQRCRPDSAEQEAALAGGKAYLRALLENGVISLDVYTRLRWSFKAAIHFPTLSEEQVAEKLEQNPALKIVMER